ncbi:NAD(P)/FAD-dependent oxidoreductase [Corallincola platygyrae]|uniref:NAD(P)/FAD-dependent oxidoreductase n=1 Tax=Corallincola platygyrae TaxID=1193278 RepID=A0ABW4XRK3_9GAMM
MTRVAVIGAGISGVVAASKLQKLGYQVDLFEKSRGRGGRMSTRRLGWADVDTGAQYFTARSDEFKAEVERWLSTGDISQWEFTPQKAIDGQLVSSPDTETRYVAMPSMSSLARQYAKDLNLYLNRRIVSASQKPRSSSKNAQWTINDESGQEWGPYQWLVSSLPGDQAKQLFSEHHDIAARLPRQSHLPCWAVALVTRGEVDPGIQGVFGGDMVSWVSRLSAKPGRSLPEDGDDLWLLHFQHLWSKSRGKDCSEQVLQEGVEWMKKHLGPALTIHHHYIHYWRYAQVSPQCQLSGPIVWPEQHIAFIGDWTAGGRVEGAYLSAVQLVEHYFSHNRMREVSTPDKILS